MRQSFTQYKGVWLQKQQNDNKQQWQRLLFISFNNICIKQNITSVFDYLLALNPMQQYRHADQIISPYGSNSIWIGDLASAEEIEWLKQQKIKTVITAAQGVTLRYDKSINHIHYKLQDSKNQNVAKILQQVADKIEKSLRQGSVLVHCGAGVSRSSTLVIGYLIKYQQMSFLEALRLAKSKRPVVCPNLGFQLQLKSFQKLLKSRRLIQAIKQRNLELPQIQKPQHKNQKSAKFSHQQKNSQTPEYNLTEMKNYRNLNVGGGFLKKLLIKRENSVVVGTKNKNSKNRQLQSSGFQQYSNKEIRDAQYLKRIAMFRFGVTNTEKWRLGSG